MNKTLPVALLIGAIAAPAMAAELPKLGDIAARHYLEQARFPEWSRPVLDAVDPLTRDRVANPVRMSGPEGAGPALVTWTNAMRYELGEQVNMYARLDGASNAAWAVAGRLESSQGVVASLPFNDAGQGADQLAGDGVYSASLSLPKAHQPALGEADNLKLLTTATSDQGDIRKGLNGFLYSNPGAELTGEFKKVFRQGNLVLLAEANVLAQGRYHLSGTLSDLGGLPVATAQVAEQLAPGTHWLELRYYGLIFHELAAVAPLQLASASLTSASTMPNALGPVLSNAFELGALPLHRLTAKPFNDPQLLDSAQRLTGVVDAPAVTAPVQRVTGLRF